MFCHPIQRWFNKISWLLITFFDLVSVLKRKRHGVGMQSLLNTKMPDGPDPVHDPSQADRSSGPSVWTVWKIPNPCRPLKIISYLVNGRSGNSSAMGKGTWFGLARNPIFGFWLKGIRASQTSPFKYQTSHFRVALISARRTMRRFKRISFA